MQVFANESGKTWEQYSAECKNEQLLAIIKSTNPKGNYGLGRIAAMEEWDRRHPVGGR